MKNNKSTMILLNLAFLIYSLSSVMSKMAAGEDVFSIRWIIFYGSVIAILLVYAVLWQMALKKVDLITAYSNKAVVVIWGMVWSVILFQEKITWPKILGICVIVIGIVVLSKGEKDA